MKSNPLYTIKEGLNTSTNEQQQDKIDLKKAGETVKRINSTEPFRVTSIIFIRQDEPKE